MKKTNKPFLAWKVVYPYKEELKSAMYFTSIGLPVTYIVGKFVAAQSGQNPALFCFKTLWQAKEFICGARLYKIFRCECKGKIESPEVFYFFPPGTVTARYVKLLKEVRR